ncbi:MAG: glycosyltransferase family 4 protein, partial [Desulfatiglandaceae bacterium]
FKVLFAGSEYEMDYFREIKELCTEYGLTEHVCFLGWRDDVTELMADADVVVLPSMDEGMPNTLQEAMYIGVPVVASPVGGVEEIVEDGVTGWVVPLDDLQGWADRLAYIAANPSQAKEVAKKGREFAEANFNAGSWAKRYADIIRDRCF